MSNRSKQKVSDERRCHLQGRSAVIKIVRELEACTELVDSCDPLPSGDDGIPLRNIIYERVSGYSNNPAFLEGFCEALTAYIAATVGGCVPGGSGIQRDLALMDKKLATGDKPQIRGPIARCTKEVGANG